jgi:hypothetical protein
MTIEYVKLKRLPRGMGALLFLPDECCLYQMPNGDTLRITNVGHGTSRRQRKLVIERVRYVDEA